MELQEKFENILYDNSVKLLSKSSIMKEPEEDEWIWAGEFEKVAKECTKLCLEEQLNSLKSELQRLGGMFNIRNYIDDLQQQLKSLEDDNV